MIYLSYESGNSMYRNDIMMDNFEEKIRKKFNNGKEYNITPIEERNGFMIFSTTKFLEEDRKFFDEYKDDECLHEFCPNIKNEPISRYLYAEKIDDNTFSSREGVLTYIMLNPSYANQKYSDKTMDRARLWAARVKNKSRKGYEYFAVINIYSFRHHIPKELKNMLKSKDSKKYNPKENWDFIDNYISFNSSKDYVLAYGNNAYKKDINKLLESLNNKKLNMYTFFDKIGKNPYHLLSTKCKVYDDLRTLHLKPLNIVEDSEGYHLILAKN